MDKLDKIDKLIEEYSSAENVTVKTDGGRFKHFERRVIKMQFSHGQFTPNSNLFMNITIRDNIFEMFDGGNIQFRTENFDDVLFAAKSIMELAKRGLTK